MRVGEVGGNTLGFLGAAWGPHKGAGETILGHSWAGALHLWQQEAGGWGPGVVGGGHQDTVADLSWDTEGRYLVSVYCVITRAGNKPSRSLMFHNH